MNYSNYVCPVCGDVIARDLVAFLHHTDAHITAKMREKYPDFECKTKPCTVCGDLVAA